MTASKFDYYEPDPPLACPVCNAGIREWQGKGGPNRLLVWRQGVARPVGQVADGDDRPDARALEAFQLPNAFRIYAPCCSRQFLVEAICRAPNGIWKSTEVITAQNAHREDGERMEQFKERLRWLRRGRS